MKTAAAQGWRLLQAISGQERYISLILAIAGEAVGEIHVMKFVMSGQNVLQ